MIFKLLSEISVFLGEQKICKTSESCQKVLLQRIYDQHNINLYIIVCKKLFLANRFYCRLLLLLYVEPTGFNQSKQICESSTANRIIGLEDDVE